jgi:hypothetical protein
MLDFLAASILKITGSGLILFALFICKLQCHPLFDENKEEENPPCSYVSVARVQVILNNSNK